MIAYRYTSAFFFFIFLAEGVEITLFLYRVQQMFCFFYAFYWCICEKVQSLNVVTSQSTLCTSGDTNLTKLLLILFLRYLASCVFHSIIFNACANQRQGFLTSTKCKSVLYLRSPRRPHVTQMISPINALPQPTTSVILWNSSYSYLWNGRNISLVSVNFH